MLHLNVGLLGHVDSGKTSLAKALSMVASTASFDKHPQSQERGITIDLGFSSFTTDIPDHIPEYDGVQFTLVDCPGHASLISTVIGGAQIIDMMVLVVDASKGVQTQTAECMVIAEITYKKLIVVLNKIDLLSEEQLKKIQKKMRATIDSMSFKGSPIVCASAANDQVQDVIESLKKNAFIPVRDAKAPFLMAVDHCFGIQGKGTILTGTILQGCVAISDDVEIPAIKATRKVKSIQMFRRAVEKAEQGDRVGVCVTQFDPKTLERGLVCRPNLLVNSYAAILDFNKVRFYNKEIASRSRYHVSIGHETLLATITLFKGPKSETGQFDFSASYQYIPSFGTESVQATTESEQIFTLVEFDRGLILANDAWVIGSRLDFNQNTSTCRMAFYGRLQHTFTSKNYKLETLPSLKVFKEKSREGTVERIVDTYTLIGQNMFSKASDLSKFIGLKVTLSTGENGVIESGFGQSGKFKIRINDGLLDSTQKLLAPKGKPTEPIAVILRHKKFIFDPKKELTQK